MSPDNIAIRVNHLSKQYKLGGPQEPYHTFRDAIVNSFKAPLKLFHKTPSVEGFWALKDVSFDVEPGEVVGIIGRNGPGRAHCSRSCPGLLRPRKELWNCMAG